MTIVLDLDSHCRSCEEGVGCGMGLLQRWLSQRSSTLVLPRHVVGMREGDKIHLAVPVPILHRLAFLAYGLPLISMLIPAMAAQTLFSYPVFLPALLGLLGFVAGVMAYPVLSRRLIKESEILIYSPIAEHDTSATV